MEAKPEVKEEKFIGIIYAKTLLSNNRTEIIQLKEEITVNVSLCCLMPPMFPF